MPALARQVVAPNAISAPRAAARPPTATAPPPPTQRPHHPVATAAAAALLAATLAATPATAAPLSSRAFFDISIDNVPAGRVVVKIFDDVPVSAARFADLVRDVDGIGYRNSKIDGVVADTEVRCSGLVSLTARAETPSLITGGETIEQLEPELAAARHSSGDVGAVSLVVKDPTAPPPETRLVAINGKLVNVERPRRGAPNGTAFVVTLVPAPQLDANNVVGTVESGLDVVREVSRLRAAQPTTDSPFFKIAKKVGDKRVRLRGRGGWRGWGGTGRGENTHTPTTHTQPFTPPLSGRRRRKVIQPPVFQGGHQGQWRVGLESEC